MKRSDLQTRFGTNDAGEAYVEVFGLSKSGKKVAGASLLQTPESTTSGVIINELGTKVLATIAQLDIEK